MYSTTIMILAPDDDDRARDTSNTSRGLVRFFSSFLFTLPMVAKTSTMDKNGTQYTMRNAQETLTTFFSLRSFPFLTLPLLYLINLWYTRLLKIIRILVSYGLLKLSFRLNLWPAWTSFLLEPCLIYHLNATWILLNLTFFMLYRLSSDEKVH